MEYDELKDYVESQLPNKSKLVVMKNVIDEIAEYFSNLKERLITDLAIEETQNNISVGTTGFHTGASITIGSRQLSANYDGDKTINVIAYEAGVLPKSDVDTIIFKDGSAVHESTGQPFDVNNVQDYLDWFKK